MNTHTNIKQRSDDYLRIEQAILYLENHYKDQPGLEEVASNIGLSEYHFQRLFTRWAGVSPKRFLQFLTKEGAKELLDKSENLLDTTHQVGLSSLGRLHDLFVTTEAVSPGEYKSRGEGVTIRYGLHASPFGKCLVAVTERGICHFGFVQTSEGEAIDTLVAGWKNAEMIEDRLHERCCEQAVLDHVRVLPFRHEIVDRLAFARFHEAEVTDPALGHRHQAFPEG